MYSTRNGIIIYDKNPKYKINKLSVMIEVDEDLKSATIMKHGDIKDVKDYMYLFSAAMGASDTVYLVILENVFEKPEDQIAALDYMVSHTLSNLTYNFVKNLRNKNENDSELNKQSVLKSMKI